MWPVLVDDPVGLSLPRVAQAASRDVSLRLGVADWRSSQGERAVADIMRHTILVDPVWAELPPDIAARWWPIDQISCGWPEKDRTVNGRFVNDWMVTGGR